jgi:formylglycine-generating enzyme
VLWAALLAAHACTKYQPKVPSGVVACDGPGQGCPAGYRCVKSVCELVKGDARGADDEVRPPAPMPDAQVASPDAPPAAPEVATAMDAPRDEAVGDLAAEAGPSAGKPDANLAGDGGALACPSTGRGPNMVRAGGFCIDATEVTNRQYQAFLAAKGSDLSGQPPLCAGKNLTFTPDAEYAPWPYPDERADHPVVNMDWCDAHAFCQWAGKRLCGKIGGGSLDWKSVTDPRVSQWASACTRAGSRAYAYGQVFRTGICNVQHIRLPVATTPVGSLGECQGGYDGVYDMIGNVEEWTDACGKDPKLGDVCSVVGGSYAPPEEEPTCASEYNEKLLYTWHRRGFRCCSLD